MAKLTKAQIKKLPQAQHCAVPSDIVYFAETTDFLGDKVFVVWHSNFEKGTMSEKRFNEIYQPI